MTEERKCVSLGGVKEIKNINKGKIDILHTLNDSILSVAKVSNCGPSACTFSDSRSSFIDTMFFLNPTLNL
ncbi:hypothetical protein L1887_23424 [Cichorium endivia]|nr:hypothetical protein L1887_23424 [Cichorium endivia]